MTQKDPDKQAEKVADDIVELLKPFHPDMQAFILETAIRYFKVKDKLDAEFKLEANK
jgi:hypothetical protein